jgi:glycine betaine/proline transport system permease protein
MPRIKIGAYVEDFVNWSYQELGAILDAISDAVTMFVSGVEWLLLAPPTIVMAAILAAVALLVRRKGVAVFTLLAFLLVDSFGLWVATMETLAVVLVSTVIAIGLGMPLGVWSSRSRTVSVTVRPLLDFMQTLPAYVYLIPAVFFFGVGLVPAVIATAVFAIPPAVRLTELGIRQVDTEMVEAANAFGAHPWQIMREVQLPLALPTVMAGVNQVIMLSLSMVVIAGLVGAAGLGGIVVSAVTQLDIAGGVEGGLAVVILAIFLDRVTAALGESNR